MEICRIIKVSELNDINFDSLGVHWTTNPEKATKHINPDNEDSFWLYAKIDNSILWGDFTSNDYSSYPGLESSGENGEFEVTVTPGSKIIVTEVYDESQECVLENINATI